MTRRRGVPVRRTSGHARRPRVIRRAHAGLSPVRAAAVLVMIAAAASLYGVAASPAFAGRSLEVEGASLTPGGAIAAAVGGGSDRSNLFSLDTRAIEARLERIPTVASAEVDVALPDAVRVRIVEREAILVWLVGERRLLVDRAGLGFADVPLEPGTTAAEAIGRLPTVDDRRRTSHSLGVGDIVDPIDLDAATRLASLTPIDVGSDARRFRLVVDDTHGYMLRAEPADWVAIFGFYTPNLRNPEIVPGQVRLLRSLLAEAGEPNVARVVLASASEGTYTVRPGP